MRQARSQLGSREAVASMAKTSRPRPEAARTGRCSILRRNASTSADLPAAGSLSRELVMGGRAPPSCGLYGTAAPAESSPASAHDSASRRTEGWPLPALPLTTPPVPGPRRGRLPHSFFHEIHGYVGDYGYAAVTLGLLLEHFGLPLPGETLLITGAVLASHGTLDIWLLLRQIGR